MVRSEGYPITATLACVLHGAHRAVVGPPRFALPHCRHFPLQRLRGGDGDRPFPHLAVANRKAGAAWPGGQPPCRGG